jgi:hypothetical protein
MKENNRVPAALCATFTEEPAKGAAAPSIQRNNYDAALRFAGCYEDCYETHRLRGDRGL